MLEKFKAIQMIDVHLLKPTGAPLYCLDIPSPEEDHRLLLDALKLQFQLNLNPGLLLPENSHDLAIHAGDDRAPLGPDSADCFHRRFPACADLRVIWLGNDRANHPITRQGANALSTSLSAGRSSG
jgi:hypothetical protein